MESALGSAGVPPAPPELPTGGRRSQEELRASLFALGFDDVRFAAIAPHRPAPLRAWLDAGLHADMHWMERSADKRLDPNLVLPGARSLIMLGVSYWSEKIRDPHSALRNSPTWARYALHEDYHDTIKPALVAAGRILETEHGASAQDYRYYVDTGPVLERTWAARAGLGFTGKNAMLISRRHGNWLFLASILTRIDFAPDEPIRAKFRERDVGLLCGNCTRCLDACPTQAFAAPGVVDARRCISYQTIENKGVIPRELRAGIGHRIYGCDVCLEVCPWNRFAQAGRQLLLSARYDLAGLTLADLLTLTPVRFAEVFRRTPIKRLKLTGLLRNACVVAGNTTDATLLPHLVTLASTHDSPLVRAHAVWAVYRLGGGAQLASAAVREADPIVMAEYAAER
ncbi:tRNA epoxyqueuosine(34) reductase QueG [Horticoccus sp. 23ND18S-11]|uniref:tRNA epoxyqueuosine(34) reductase QueG n=1 Tax=Horticoccus sp. 23ND18S-11 TaxID=3391832 RepID=UPI0039C8E01F